MNQGGSEDDNLICLYTRVLNCRCKEASKKKPREENENYFTNFNANNKTKWSTTKLGQLSPN